MTGTDWGADVHSLRLSSLFLVFSTAEYYAPVWGHSKHIGHIDTKLNICMRTISGLIKSTPIQWLPILSNIVPQKLRRENLLVKHPSEIRVGLLVSHIGRVPRWWIGERLYRLYDGRVSGFISSRAKKPDRGGPPN